MQAITDKYGVNRYMVSLTVNGDPHTAAEKHLGHARRAVVALLQRECLRLRRRQLRLLLAVAFDRRPRCGPGRSAAVR